MNEVSLRKTNVSCFSHVCILHVINIYITCDKHIVSYLYGWNDNNKEDQWQEGERERRGNGLGHTGWSHWRQLRAMRKGRVDLGGFGSVLQEQNHCNRHLICYALEEKTKAAWGFFFFSEDEENYSLSMRGWGAANVVTRQIFMPQRTHWGSREGLCLF